MMINMQKEITVFDDETAEQILKKFTEIERLSEKAKRVYEICKKLHDGDGHGCYLGTSVGSSTSTGIMLTDPGIANPIYAATFEYFKTLKNKIKELAQGI
jgi:activator of 2-hydroxyglutaryl-CoA dehydratase